MGEKMFRKSALKTAEQRLFRYIEHREADPESRTELALQVLLAFRQLMLQQGVSGLHTIRDVFEMLPAFQKNTSRGKFLDMQAAISKGIDRAQKTKDRPATVGLMFVNGLLDVYQYHPASDQSGKPIKKKDNRPEELLHGFVLELGRMMEHLGQDADLPIDPV